MTMAYALVACGGASESNLESSGVGGSDQAAAGAGGTDSETGGTDGAGGSTGGAGASGGAASGGAASGGAASGGSGGTGIVCGDGSIAGEECDDGNQLDGDGCSASCNSEDGYSCTGDEPSVCSAVCGDGLILGDEECDDGNSGDGDGCSADCNFEAGFDCGGAPTVCTSICGDGQSVGDETCDDGNQVGADGCSDTCHTEDYYLCTGAPSVCAPECGDGVVIVGEACDDGNEIDTDACTNACKSNAIVLSGNAHQYVQSALEALGETYTIVDGGDGVGAPPASGIFISANDGCEGPFPSLSPLLDAGGHVLLVGGSALTDYTTWVGNYVTTDGAWSWHQSNDCTSDWSTVGSSTITKYLPATYDFTSQSISYHMLHFTAAQPEGAVILGNTCHGANPGVLVSRTYASQGSFTYMGLDLGQYSDAGSQAGFVMPFLKGYLEYARSAH
jgi:cysteine-rich repeat protein